MKLSLRQQHYANMATEPTSRNRYIMELAESRPVALEIRIALMDSINPYNTQLAIDLSHTKPISRKNTPELFRVRRDLKQSLDRADKVNSRINSKVNSWKEGETDALGGFYNRN